MIPKFNVFLKKIGGTSPLVINCLKNNGSYKTPKHPLQQLRPKTPEDEYEELFRKTMKKSCEQDKKPEKVKAKLTEKECRVNATAKPIKVKGELTMFAEFSKVDQKRLSKSKEAPAVGVPQQGMAVKETRTSDKDNVVSKMNALILIVKNQEVALGQVPIPNVLRKDEVSVKVRYAMASQTDLAVIEGKLKSSKEEVIPGRELSGLVCGTGDDVQHVKAGDCVVVAPCLPTSLCKFCQEEKLRVCVKEKSGEIFGIDRDGAWAQFAAVPANLVYKVNDISLKKAVLLPLMAQVMCALAKMKISPHKKILVLGCGLPGALFALLLQHNGHERVSIWEDNPNRMALIHGLGTNYPIVSAEDLAEINIDLVISNGGGATAMQQALNALSPHGQFVVFGQPGKNGIKPQLIIDTPSISRRTVTITGMSGTPANPSNISPALANQILDLEKLGVSLFNIKDFKDALTQLSTGDINSAILQTSKEK